MPDVLSVASDDTDLVERSRAGDRRAFGRIVERYQSLVASIAYSSIGDLALSQDIAQETFIRAYSALHQFRGDAQFYTWLYRIAVNLCVDQRRREAKHAEVALETDERGEGPLPSLPDGPRPDQPFERTRDAEIAHRVQAAMAELTPEHRAVILLREVEGLSYAEIGEVLDCPKGTVMSRLHYARRQMQARLQGLL